MAFSGYGQQFLDAGTYPSLMEAFPRPQYGKYSDQKYLSSGGNFAAHYYQFISLPICGLAGPSCLPGRLALLYRLFYYAALFHPYPVGY